MKARRSALPALVAGALFLSSSAAQADEVHESRVLYQKGNSAYQKGDSILARDYYEKSLALRESFDTLCNLGRVQAEDKLYPEAYLSLSRCVLLYPEDPELGDARTRFVDLKSEVRGRLASQDAERIDQDVWRDAEERRKAADSASNGEGGLDGSEASGGSAVSRSERRWKLPVVLSLAGAGVAGGVFGGVMLARAGSLRKDADALRGNRSESACAPPNADPMCARLSDIVAKSDSSLVWGVGGAVTGGVLLAGALAVSIFVPQEKEESRGGESRGGESAGGAEARRAAPRVGLDWWPSAVVRPGAGEFQLGVSGSF